MPSKSPATKSHSKKNLTTTKPKNINVNVVNDVLIDSNENINKSIKNGATESVAGGNTIIPPATLEDKIVKLLSKTLAKPKREYGPQSRHWCFTLFKYNVTDFSAMILDDNILSIRCQEEVCPTSNREHIQGYCILKKIKRMSYLQNVFNEKCHMSVCFNGQGAYNYCLKDETRKPNGMRWDTMDIKDIKKPKRQLLQIQIDDFYPWEWAIWNIWLSEPNHRALYWFYSELGNLGKSYFVNYFIDNFPDEVLFFEKGKYEDLCFAITEKDMNLVKLVIWDMPKTCNGYICSMIIEALSNGRVRSTKYEGKFVRFAPVHVFCLGNSYPAEKDNLMPDRWHIAEITSKEEDLKWEDPKDSEKWELELTTCRECNIEMYKCVAEKKGFTCKPCWKSKMEEFENENLFSNDNIYTDG